MNSDAYYGQNSYWKFLTGDAKHMDWIVSHHPSVVEDYLIALQILNADEADDFVFNTKLLLFISAVEWNDFMFFDGPFEQFLHFKGTFFLHYQPKFVFER